jgi:hypothetical protein
VFSVETVDTSDNLSDYRIRLLLLAPLGTSGHCLQSIQETSEIQQALISYTIITLSPNETVEKPLLRKMFIKISHNRLENCQEVAKKLC